MGKTDIEMHLEKLVQNIKNVRIARGYTFEYMSTCLGITVSAYHKIEHHKTKLTIERLLHIAQILDIDVTELWSAPTKTEAPNEKTKNFWCKLQVILSGIHKSAEEKIINSQKEEISYLRELLYERMKEKYDEGSAHAFLENAIINNMEYHNRVNH